MGKLLMIAMFLIGSTSAWAHGGRTNAQGCHNDRKNGGYHCHGGATATPSGTPRLQSPVPVSPPSKPIVPKSPKVSPQTEPLSQPSHSMTIAERLRELERRYQNALILPDEYRRQRAELLEQQRQMEAAPQPASLAAPSSPIEEQLQALKRQRENGEISSEEYYEKRGKLLKGL